LDEFGLERSDLNEAFENRYGLHPSGFEKGIDIPEEVENAIDKKSDLVNLSFVSVYIRPERREELLEKCNGIIKQWQYTLNKDYE
jgi:hypothetical protein